MALWMPHVNTGVLIGINIGSEGLCSWLGGSDELVPGGYELEFWSLSASPSDNNVGI